MKEVKIILEDGAFMPAYAKQGDSGVDFFCKEETIIPPHAKGYLIDTGVKIELPQNHELQVRPKSGVSLKSPLRVVLGTVDEGYRGTIGIIVDNFSNSPVIISKGKSIAQGVLQYVPKIKFVQTFELNESERGKGGFGSTNRGI